VIGWACRTQGGEVYESMALKCFLVWQSPVDPFPSLSDKKHAGVDERGASNVIDGVKRGSPADFLKMAQESTNTLVIPTK
jgi:hypothetical protein